VLLQRKSSDPPISPFPMMVICRMDMKLAENLATVKSRDDRPNEPPFHDSSLNYRIVRPTAGAITRNSFISAEN